MNNSSFIPQAPAPAGYKFRDVQLELSLKPFWDDSLATREVVCREVFLQWFPLCRFADTVSVMLWAGDGSEILEYAGDIDAEFEWGRYLGSANPIQADPVPDTDDTVHTAVSGNIEGRDPEKRGVHQRSYLYRPEPARFTFRWLRDLIADLKRIGKEITGKRILVGGTFDIGPEFAVSRFKYQWHREICGGGLLFGGKFIRCDALLKSDERRYAGFSNGIPDGTSMGTFLGRQTRHFLRDLPLDFLWFSNGFGFGLEPWSLTGAIFDGAEFRAEAVEETTGRILRFWRDFREEAPGVPIRTRGTNLATGIDLGSDASPWREIYRDVPDIDAPPNSPWAALDGDVGLELAGWMSHIARLPNAGYRYRFYIHDPWWLNSPWLDRYQRHPFDIHIPLSVSRMRSDGSVEPPADIAFLSVDDTHGRMPANVPIEVIPHVLHAREFVPDAPAPLVWVYPWDAYHDLTQGPRRNPALPFFGDWFVRGLITHTVPVNTVADFAGIASLIAKNDPALAGSVLLSPVLPDGFGVTEKLVSYAEAGGRVLLYGPLADSKLLREMLGIECAEPLEGDFELQLVRNDGGGNIVRHLHALSAGGWSETGGNAFVTARQNGKSRTASALHEFSTGGKLGWVRGSLATSEYDPKKRNKIHGPRLNELNGREFFATEKLARPLLARMGLGIEVRNALPDGTDPMLCIHRHENAFVFSGYQPAVDSEVEFRFEHGAPLFTGMQNMVADNATTHGGPTSWHHVCRVFAEQAEASKIECRIIPPIQHGYTSRLLVSGAKNATLHFFPEPAGGNKLEILRNPKFPYFVGDFVKPRFSERGNMRWVTVGNVTGELLFSW